MTQFPEAYARKGMFLKTELLRAYDDNLPQRHIDSYRLMLAEHLGCVGLKIRLPEPPIEVPEGLQMAAIHYFPDRRAIKPEEPEDLIA